MNAYIYEALVVWHSDVWYTPYTSPLGTGPDICILGSKMEGSAKRSGVRDKLPMEMVWGTDLQKARLIR